MPKTIPQSNSLFISPAKVIAVYEEDRTIDVQWMDRPSTKSGVIVVETPGNFSMPRIGDYGVVLGNGIIHYFMGTIEYAYALKISGEATSTAGIPLSYKKVKAGEVHFANQVKQIWLNLTESGNFSLMNGFSEGLEYIKSTRIASVLGKTVKLLGNGVTVAAGNAIRNIPGKGDTPAPGVNGGKALEILMQIAYQGVQTVRLHLGDITDLVTGTVSPSTVSAWTLPLKAILEVTAGLVALGKINIDSAGNIEIKSETGMVSINSGTEFNSIHLGGGMPPAIHGVPFGDLLITWLTQHTHASPMGPTGTPIIPPTSAMVSQKVFTN